MQQKILKTHSFQTLSGITSDILPKVKDKILKIPGIFAMNRSKQYLSMGKYRLLTQANLPYARLQLIDDILSKIQFSPDHIPPGGSPRRLVPRRAVVPPRPMPHLPHAEVFFPISICTQITSKYRKY